MYDDMNVFTDESDTDETMRLDRNSNEEKSSEGLLIAMAVFLVILIPFCIVGALYLYRNKTANPEAIPVPPPVVSAPVVLEDSVLEEHLEETDESQKTVNSRRMTYFTGYEGEAITVSANMPLYLRNEIDNAEMNIYMQYQIYDVSENKIYESKLLKAGTSEVWKANEVLPEGEQMLQFHQQPYLLEDTSMEALSENMIPLDCNDQSVRLFIM